MAHYVLFTLATGALVSAGASEPPRTAAQAVKRFEQTPPVGAVWDPALLDYGKTRAATGPALNTAAAELAAAEADLAAAMVVKPVRGSTAGLRATVLARRAVYYQALVAHNAAP
jgi:hypothetical protein